MTGQTIRKGFWLCQSKSAIFVRRSLCEYDHRADNLLYRDGRYMSLHDKGTINIIEDEERGYRVGFEIDGIKFSGEDLENY